MAKPIYTLEQYRILSMMLKLKSSQKEVRLLKSRHVKEIRPQA